MTDIPEANPALPILVVISGPSGVGKDTVIQELRKLDRPWHFPVTATTRLPRPGEQDGKEYHFLARDEFEKKIQRSEFLEYAEVYGNFYGVPRSEIRDNLKTGKDVVLKIDVQGAATIKKLVPESVLIFLIAESKSALISRLANRQTEELDDLERRISTAETELSRIAEFDYRVINREGDIHDAANTIDSIICAEKARLIPRMAELI